MCSYLHVWENKAKSNMKVLSRFCSESCSPKGTKVKPADGSEHIEREAGRENGGKREREGEREVRERGRERERDRKREGRERGREKEGRRERQGKRGNEGERGGKRGKNKTREDRG